MARSSWPSSGGALTALAVAACCLTSEASSSLGGLGGAYLRPPVGATALALGGAYAASPDYLSGWWNPALPATFKDRRLSIGTGLQTQGRAEGFLSLESRLPPRMGIGITLLYRGDPHITGLHDADENVLAPGSFTTLTAKIMLSYFVNRRLSAGLSVGGYYQSLTAYAENMSNEWAYTMGGIDLGMRYKARDDLAIGLAIQNLNVAPDWVFQSGDLGSSSTDAYPPAVTLASHYTAKLRGKPFAWNCDLKTYAFDGALRRLSRPTAFLDNGVEWQRWSNVFLRAGIGDVALSGDLVSNNRAYLDDFTLTLCAGLLVDLSTVRNGLKVNYGLATDKIWAGVNQQLDVVYSF